MDHTVCVKDVDLQGDTSKKSRLPLGARVYGPYCSSEGRDTTWLKQTCRLPL